MTREERVVACGPPEAIARSPSSHTGRALAPYLRMTPPRIEPAPLPMAERGAKTIRIRGARQHNLKRLDVDIPRDRIVVLTGLSGSGKSSLAFDIVFAEGQRRFLESLSAFARQYIQVLDKPEVDLVSGMPPTIAIEQRLTSGGRKSTVATVTEVYHYLRLLFAKLGVPHCVDCRLPIRPSTEDQILAEIESRFAGERLSLFTPLVRARKGAHREIIERARKNGFEKLRIDGKIVETSRARPLRRYVEHDIEALVAEIDLARDRIEAGLLKRALAIGKGAISSSRERRARTTTRAAPAPGARGATRSRTRGSSLSTASTAPARSARGWDRWRASTRSCSFPIPTAASRKVPSRRSRLDAANGLMKAPKRLPGLLGTRLRRLVAELGIDPDRAWRRIAAEKRTAPPLESPRVARAHLSRLSRRGPGFPLPVPLGETLLVLRRRAGSRTSPAPSRSADSASTRLPISLPVEALAFLSAVPP